MKSDFQFLSYKIDEINFRIEKSLDILLFNQTLPPNDYLIDVAFRNPIFIKSKNIYVGGMELKISYEAKNPDDPGIKKTLIDCKLGISGAFQANEGKFTKEIEEKLVFLQIPAILLPYARACILNLFANSGLGSFIFPLINIQKMASDVREKMELQILE